MSVSDNIFQLYQRFYAQKGVLTDAPRLTIDVNTIGRADFPADQAMAEMSAVAAYLMGVSNVTDFPFEKLVTIVKDAYAGQDFWQTLLYDFLGVMLDVSDDKLNKKAAELKTKIDDTLDELMEHDNKVNRIAQHFADKIAAEKFHVDGKRLIQNYFKMMRRDASEAWKVLITNPAYFSPIVTRDETGKSLLSPAQAISENDRLAKFLKNVKG